MYFLFSLFILLGCKKSDDNSSAKLKKLNCLELGIAEPSGLALSKDGNYFWTVSDENSTIYKIDKSGKPVETITTNGYDLEGITVIDDTTLAVMFEREREVLILKTNGEELKRKKLDLKGKLNSGLEGIAFNPNDNCFYLLNEKDPGLLIKLDYELNILDKKELTFAKDFSSIYYDEINNNLWINSDESALIAKCSLDGDLIKIYEHHLPQIEGIHIDIENNTAYLISDNTESLYTFKLVD